MACTARHFAAECPGAGHSVLRDCPSAEFRFAIAYREYRTCRRSFLSRPPCLQRKRCTGTVGTKTKERSRRLYHHGKGRGQSWPVSLSAATFGGRSRQDGPG